MQVGAEGGRKGGCRRVGLVGRVVAGMGGRSQALLMLIGFDGAGKHWGQAARARYTPAGPGRMKPGEVAFFFSLYEKNRWPWYWR